MFVAVDKDGNRVYASADTDRSIDYFCPVCGGKVRLRSWKTENLNVPHFAHVNKDECTDDFTADMSEWHRAWQELFPIKNREVVITHGEEKHRADVLCYGTVIEFQHSTISEAEFWRRNNFYTSAGYKVVWLFDLSDMRQSDKDLLTARLFYHIEDNGRSWDWKYPWRMLSSFYPQKEKDISVFFQFDEFSSTDSKKEQFCIEQIVWAYGNCTIGITGEKVIPWGRFISSFRIRNKVQLLDWLRSRWLNGGVDNYNCNHDIVDCWSVLLCDSLVDGWHYGDSLWGNKWKNCFPNSRVNVTVACTDYDCIRQGADKPIKKVHLLDVYENGTAVFFHKGSICKDEFIERNNVLLCHKSRFRCAPYVNHVAWVFDVQEEFERGFLKYESRDDNKLFLTWENPERVIGFANFVSSSLENVSIWLAWKDDDGERLTRIKSCARGFERIWLENSVVRMSDDIVIERFSFTEEEWERRASLNNRR